MFRELIDHNPRRFDRNYQHREVKMETLRRVSGPVVLAACLAIFSSAATATETKPAINLDIAKKMIAACEAKAKQEGWKMNVAIVDDGANLVAFERMDGAFLGSIQIAQHKAITSANFPFSTRRFSEIAFGKDGKPGMVPGIANFPGIVAFAGGLPIITANNVQIGGIGVSGGTSDQDELCAQAGVDAVKGDLT
jgi:glc operon protein GlcG